ncbi:MULTISPECIES: DUF4113 domain-containing protein [Oceanimonas]|uniref:DUF4113 domain-containing protein n=1 Tax=Oceanimonas doudoroffii TaxID=84158 RepID=A0A233RJ44_9GAMM|nr:hypothetical protein B6S08_07965 [Oceanimonas doudoroffii]
MAFPARPGITWSRAFLSPAYTTRISDLPRVY